MLLTYLLLGNAWRMGVVLEFFIMILSFSFFIINIIGELKNPKVNEDYSLQIDDTTIGNQDSVYTL